MLKHSARKHALLSPSGSYRWMACPASARLEDEHGKDSGNSFASEEGTVAHEMAEHALAMYAAGKYNPETDVLPVSSDIHNIGKYYTWEMEQNVKNYVMFVLGKQKENDCKEVYIERGFDLGRYVKESFGSCDSCMNNTKKAIIIDLKYGRSKVKVEGNSQTRMYALGFLESLTEEERNSIETIEMYIAQVRLDSYACEVLTKEELLNWADTVLTPAADKAYSGDSEKVIGSHCYFCKFKTMCEANLSKRINDLFG